MPEIHCGLSAPLFSIDELESTTSLPGQTGIRGRRGTDMSTISDKLFLRSTASIFDATLSFNFLVCSGSRTKLLWIDMMLVVRAANHNGAVSGQHITDAVSALALSNLAAR